MADIRILWADDEIESLKAQVLFLQNKGYDVTTVSNGYDAVEIVEKDPIDVVFLDESMPGITGLETLTRIKAINKGLPVVLITKSETEDIMDQAIGSQITDYLIKPVNPNQILLALKKIVDNNRLVRNTTTTAYQQEFNKIFSAIQMGLNHEEWIETYRKLIYWELELDHAKTDNMREVLTMQKNEANTEFYKYFSRNYMKWLKEEGDRPTLSHTLLHDKIFPNLSKDKPNILILIDNLRFDQWKIIQPILNAQFRTLTEACYYSIIPTATHYSRNAIFAGLSPKQISERYPQYWKDDADEGGKNLHEETFLAEHLKRVGKGDLKFSYTKVTNHEHGKNLVDNIHNLLQNDLSIIVYNFVDMLSHARTEMEVLKELASDEAAYRSITRSWFEHSPLWQALRRLEGKNINLFVTTDHGSIRVQRPSKVVGDKNTTTNLRYKHGRNLQYNNKEVYEVRKPGEAMLPRPNVSSSFIFAKEDMFFVYPNNYNHYVNYYKNTFQHGGISLEEIIIPVIQLESK